MTNHIHRSGVLAIVVAALAVADNFRTSAFAEDKKASPPSGAKVFLHPEKLTAKDKLSFGEGGEKIEIKGETTLVWVDLSPDARFGHSTECILISAEGTRVVKGDWWLVLNGKDLFRDGKEHKMDFPVKLSGK